MPIYTVENEHGKPEEVLMSVAEYRKRTKLIGGAHHLRLDDGRTLLHLAGLDFGVTRGTPGNWPKESDALGVNPSQLSEAVAHAREHGVNCEWNPKTGNPILKNQAEQRALARACGFRDRSGYVG